MNNVFCEMNMDEVMNVEGGMITGILGPYVPTYIGIETAKLIVKIITVVL